MAWSATRNQLPLIHAASLFHRWLPWTYCWVVLLLSTESTAITHVMFANTTLWLKGGPGSGGSIISSGYPDYISRGNFSRMLRPASLLLIACPECRISLIFSVVALPYCQHADSYFTKIQHYCYSSVGCNYLYLHEPFYEKSTRRFIRRSTNYISISRSVQLVFCKGRSYENNIRFKINYKLEAKTSTSDEKHNGSLQSPNYPGPYALNGDVYIYTIYSPGKYIRLKFDGYDLSGQSTIQIYYNDKKGARENFTQGGTEPRIAVALSYEYLKVIFTAENRTNNQVPYLGFHACYEYTAVASWSEVPNVVRGKYFHRQPGGHFESPDCLPGDRVDCLWVIGSPSEVGASRVLVNFEENHYVDRWQLEIRRGITSDAPLVHTTRSVFSSSGVYIRLKYDCQRSAFKATFTYFVPTNSYNNYCTNRQYTFQCMHQDRCISRSLVCDGYDNCGDSADEHTCPGTTTHPWCASGVMYCHNHKKICAEQRCDGITDCPSGADEEDCLFITTQPPQGPSDGLSHWSTIVPIILICVIIIIVGCIIITWYMQCRRRQRQLYQDPRQHLRRTHRMQTVTEQLGSVNWPGLELSGLEERDTPPAYHDAVLYSPRAGEVNLGYTRTDPLDALVKPPPYSPTLGLERIPPPAYEQISIQALTDRHANPQALTDRHANPQALTDRHADPQVLTDDHTNPQALTDRHVDPQALTDRHVDPQALTDRHANPQVLADMHVNPQALTDRHANPQGLTDRHANPQVLTDDHASPHPQTRGFVIEEQQHCNSFDGTTLQFVENPQAFVEELNATTV